MFVPSAERAYALAKTIRAVVFDVDGVFTDNRVLEGAPYKGKWRSYYDGQGISLLRAVGIAVCFITNEKGESAAAITGIVDKFNNLPSSQRPDNMGGWRPVRLFTGMGGIKKVTAAEEFLRDVGVDWEDCAAMGDDLVDVPLLQYAALRAAPPSAELVIRRMCHFVSERPGGNGAIRDFANFILEAREIDPLSLPPQ